MIIIIIMIVLLMLIIDNHNTNVHTNINKANRKTMIINSVPLIAEVARYMAKGRYIHYTN